MTATAEPIFDYGSADAYPEQLYAFNDLARGVDSFTDISDDEVAAFHHEGYLVIHRAFDAAQVQSGLDGLFDLIAGANPDFKGIMYEHAAHDVNVGELPLSERQDYVRKFMWFVDYEARLKALADNPQLRATIERLMGEPPLLFQDMALLKPPHRGREKPWHQDHAYFELPLTTTVVGAWIALDPATTENGCMVIVPGSHRQGPVVHFQRRDWQLCDTHVDNRGALAVPLAPGGCLLFHSLIHHGTPANRSDQRRRAVQFHYRPQSAPRTSVEERLAVFGAEGKDVTC